MSKLWNCWVSMQARVFEFIWCLCSTFRVNKPYLPIAAGDLSVKSAWLLVIFFVVAGLTIVGLNFGSFITSLYTLGLFLGTIYSVPPFRMKRFPVAAFLIIATVTCVSFFLPILKISQFMLSGRLVKFFMFSHIRDLRIVSHGILERKIAPSRPKTYEIDNKYR